MDAIVRIIRRITRRFQANMMMSLSICIGAVLLIVLVGVLLSLRNKDKPAESDPLPVSSKSIEDVKSDIEKMAKSYYDAYANGDVATMKSLIDVRDETGEIEIEVRGGYIDSIKIDSITIKEGLSPDTYLGFVSYEMKFKDIDTPASGMTGFLFTYDDDGKLHMAKKGYVDDATKEHYQSESKKEDIVALIKEVNTKFENAKATDPALDAFMNEYAAKLKEEIGERLAQLNAEQNAPVVAAGVEEIPEATETQTSTAPAKTFVKTTSSVNVRGSDSTNGEKLGNAPLGSVYECVEKQINGWTKIIYEGRSAYINSEFLVDVADAASAAAGNKVTVIESVKIRKEPSTTAEILGGAKAGDSLALIEKRSDGWTKIKFNGHEAYVKSEYVQ